MTTIHWKQEYGDVKGRTELRAIQTLWPYHRAKNERVWIWPQIWAVYVYSVHVWNFANFEHARTKLTVDSRADFSVIDPLNDFVFELSGAQ